MEPKLLGEQQTEALPVSSRDRSHASIDTPFATEFSIELSGALDSEDIPHLEDVVSLDPEVLASLVIQLRSNMSSVIKERDEARAERDVLVGDLAIMQTRLQELEGAHEREVEMLNEMASWRKKCEEAEEQVALLRQKVEESRRAVMTLQTQSRRQSQLGVGYAGSPHATSFALDSSPRNSAFNKRSSLQIGAVPTPLLGPPPKSSRRESSSSEPGNGNGSNDSHSSHVVSTDDPSPMSRQTSEQDAESKAAKRASHRQSSTYVRHTESLLNPMGAEMENLRHELNAVKHELTETKQELCEAIEAKEASDVCLKALKEFINENSIGGSSSPDIHSSSGADSTCLRGLSLPPLPTDTIADGDEDGQWTKTPVATHAHSSSAGKKGWSLGFWGSTAPAESSSTTTAKSRSGNDGVSQSSASPAQTTKSPIVSAGPLSSFVSRWRRSDATDTMPNVTSSTMNPNPSTSSSSAILSTFKWSTLYSPTVALDNTLAPSLGGNRRQSSAYSNAMLDDDDALIERRVSSISPYSRGTSTKDEIRISTQLTEEPENTNLLDETKRSPGIHSKYYVDSTPSLTDTETNPTSISGESEPASPTVAKASPLADRKLAIDMGPQDGKQESLTDFSPPTTPKSRRGTSIGAKFMQRPKAFDPSVPSASPHNIEFGRTQAPPRSPKKNVSELPKIPLMEGRDKMRPRAASNSRIVLPGMETIQELGPGPATATPIKRGVEN